MVAKTCRTETSSNEEAKTLIVLTTGSKDSPIFVKVCWVYIALYDSAGAADLSSKRTPIALTRWATNRPEVRAVRTTEAGCAACNPQLSVGTKWQRFEGSFLIRKTRKGL